MVAPISNTKRFQLGHLVATPGAIKALIEAGQSAIEFVSRHQLGDCGDVEPGDKRANERALADGERILSAYVLKTGVRIWVITEAEDDDVTRNSTCVLLPSEH